MNRWRKYFKDFLNFRDNREAKLKYLGKGGVKSQKREEIENTSMKIKI